MVMINTSVGDRSLRSFIDTEHGTLSRELYVNPDIFQQELEQIFGRCWLFIGHESLVPNPGDFMTTRMGGEEAGLEVFTPFQKWRVPTNWKVPAFTSSRDPEHGAMTHRSVNAAAIGPMRDLQAGGGERHGMRERIPADIYVVGDHNLGHGG